MAVMTGQAQRALRHALGNHAAANELLSFLDGTFVASSASSGNTAGTAVTITGGAGAGTGAGGAINGTAGASGTGATGNGGAVTYIGGAALSTNGTGGAFSGTGGAGAGTGAGGLSKIVGGAGGATGAGGAVQMTGGAGGATSGTGGAATIAGGAGTNGNATGGIASLTGGAGQGTGAGAAAKLVGGASGAGATGNGADAEVTGGAALSTNGSGGSCVVTPGVKTGTGIAGGVFLRSATNQIFRSQAAVPADLADTAPTLTAAQMLAGILTGTPTTGRAYTFPSGTAMSAGCPASLAVGDSFELTIINLAVGADDIITLTQGSAGFTIVGKATIDAGDAAGNSTSATIRCANTAANTWVAYRL